MAAQERTPANTTPQDVLDFWFGEGVWGTAKMGDESPAAFAHKTPLWWGFKAVISSAISAHPAAMLVSACVVTCSAGTSNPARQGGSTVTRTNFTTLLHTWLCCPLYLSRSSLR